ncbi:hypothetical protein [Nostoc punctiforme]|nr:hypothetical protein [Nostoc punctiforme]
MCVEIWQVFAIASPQIKNKLVLCKAYRDQTKKRDRDRVPFQMKGVA